MFIDISGIDLFDQNVGKTCGQVRLRCSWIVVVLIYLIKMQIRHVVKLDSNVHG